MNRRFPVSVILTILLILYTMIYPKADVQAVPEEPSGLYGQSALIMDADSKRVLYEKNGYEQLPMASTTKIMTCLVALEEGNLESEVLVSEHAAAQPDVQMNICTGETYKLGDLLYGMMLESFNDVAVAVAEHIGETVEGFALLMNEKAESLGCQDTYFITPNGLDAQDEQGIHSTTARDLAVILSAAIQNPKFLEITQASSWEIHQTNGERVVTAHNKNALLGMMDGAISGKTGFTGKAGFCYAGAVQRGDRTFVAVTLACGWPPHKGYKWQDMTKLFQYGFDAFWYKTITWKEEIPEFAMVTEGQQMSFSPEQELSLIYPEMELTVLTRIDENISVDLVIPDNLAAPIKKGQSVGQFIYRLDDEVLEIRNITSAKEILKENYSWDIYKIFCHFFCIYI